MINLTSNNINMCEWLWSNAELLAQKFDAKWWQTNRVSQT
jgi:hypothetical protein